MTIGYQLSHAQSDTLSESLKMGFRHLVAAELDCRVRAMMIQFRLGQLDPAGLLNVHRNGQLVATMFTQYRPDQSLLIWPPGILPKEDTAAVTELLLTGVRNRSHQLAAKTVILLHDQDQSFDKELFAKEGFQYLSDLVYLTAMVGLFPTQPTVNSVAATLRFVPCFERALSQRSEAMEPSLLPPDVFQEMTNLVEATYQETLDFPQLLGDGPTDQILAGYQATGQFRPELWLRVLHQEQTAGVLLLTDNPEDNFVELVYMGLFPEYRRRGLSLPIVHHTLWTARQLGRLFVLVSVDHQNTPAMRSYQRCGFQRCDRKSLYIQRGQPE